MTTEYGNADIAMNNEILRCEVGSGLHGLAIAGTDDHDECGIFIEPPEHVIGLEKPLESYTFRTQPEGHRSGHGDTDLVIYSLRHYLKLAVAGNPSILTVLFAPDQSIYKMTTLGMELRGIRDAFLSVKALRRFLGYLDGQTERMQGGGKQNRVPNRPELIEKYGYDTKYASHALRLAYQGLEIARYGKMTLPMVGFEREHVRSMKTGGCPTVQDALTEILIVRDALVRHLDDRELAVPSEPDYRQISKWSIDAHQRHWGLRDVQTN